MPIHQKSQGRLPASLMDTFENHNTSDNTQFGGRCFNNGLFNVSRSKLLGYISREGG